MVVHRSKNLDALDDMGRMYRPIQDLVQCQSLGYPELRSTHRNHKRDQPRPVLNEFRRPLLGQSVSTRRVSLGQRISEYDALRPCLRFEVSTGHRVSLQRDGCRGQFEDHRGAKIQSGRERNVTRPWSWS